MNSLLIARNIITRTFRSRKEIIGLVILPIIIISVLTFVISQANNSQISLGLVNNDQNSLSLVLINYLQKENNFNLITLDEANVQEALRQKKLNAVLTIPAHFTQDVAQGKKVTLKISSLQTNASIDNIKQNILQYLNTLYTAQNVAADLSSKLGENSEILINSLINQINAKVLPINYHLIGTNEGTANFESFNSAIGFALMFIMILIFSIIGTIMEDKKNLTLARLFISPIKEWEIVAGNLLGCLSLGLIQLIPLVFVLQNTFNIPWGLQLAEVFLTLFCFLITSLGLGIGLAGITKRSFDPAIIMATVIVPSCIIGGSLVPSSMLPSLINNIGYAVPQKWVMETIWQILYGLNSQAILLNLGVILLFGLAFASFGVKTIKPL